MKKDGFHNHFRSLSDEDSLEFVRRLMNSGEDINKWYGEKHNFWNILMMSCVDFKLKTINFLLENGADKKINEYSGNGNNALSFLIYAIVRKGTEEEINSPHVLEILKKFEKHGADFNAEGDKGCSPMEYLFYCLDRSAKEEIKINDELFDFLLERTDVKIRDNHFSPENIMFELIKSPVNLTPENVAKIVKKGFDFNEQKRISSNSKSNHFLFVLTWYTKSKAFQKNKRNFDNIFSKYNFNFDTVGASGNDVITEAIRSNSEYVFKKTIKSENIKEKFKDKDFLEKILNESVRSGFNYGILFAVKKINKLGVKISDLRLPEQSILNNLAYDLERKLNYKKLKNKIDIQYVKSTKIKV